MPNDFSGYESGPFCRHYSDPSDCERDCGCGHKCGRHDLREPVACMECDCKEYREQCNHRNRTKYGSGPWICTNCKREIENHDANR